jgi:hypothetical protein
MAHAPEIPSDALASIARQIGSRLPRPGAPGAPSTVAFERSAEGAAPIEIGESFPVYMLGVDKLQGGDDNLPRIVRPTGVWQHQIRIGDEAQDIARSTAPKPGAPAGGDGWQVQEVVRSAAAPRIDAAIAWIDQNKDIAEDAVANLLLVPAFYLTAFWLHETQRDNVVIADMPPRLGDLEILHLYPAQEFLKRLAAVTPISGVPVVQDRAAPAR